MTHRQDMILSFGLLLAISATTCAAISPAMLLGFIGGVVVTLMSATLSVLMFG